MEKHYEAPSVQVIDMEVQESMMQTSPFGGVKGNEPYGNGGDPFDNP